MQPSQRVVTATANEMSWRVFSPSFVVWEFAPLSVRYPFKVSGDSLPSSPTRAPISLCYWFQSMTMVSLLCPQLGRILGSDYTRGAREYGIFSSSPWPASDQGKLQSGAALSFHARKNLTLGKESFP